MYSCYLLTPNSRLLLLKHFLPKFHKSIAHHVTYKFGSDDYPPIATIKVVGYASNDKIECLVVEVDGTTIRPDGGTYHITWSLDPEKAKPVMSNDLLRQNDWTPVTPIEIQTIPAVEN